MAGDFGLQPQPEPQQQPEIQPQPRQQHVSYPKLFWPQQEPGGVQQAPKNLGQVSYSYDQEPEGYRGADPSPAYGPRYLSGKLWETNADSTLTKKNIGVGGRGASPSQGGIGVPPAQAASASSKGNFSPQQAAAPVSNADKLMKSVDPVQGGAADKSWASPAEGSHLPSIGDPYFPKGYTVPTTPGGPDAMEAMLRGKHTVNPNVTPGQGTATIVPPRNGSGVPGAGQLTDGEVPGSMGAFNKSGGASMPNPMAVNQQATAQQAQQEWKNPFGEDTVAGKMARAAYEDWKANPEAYRDPIAGNFRAKYIHSLHQPGVVSISGGYYPGANMRDASNDALRDYLAYQGHAAAMAHGSATTENTLANAASARAGGLPTEKGSMDFYEKMKNLSAKNPEIPVHERLLNDPTAEIGDFASGLAADKIPQGSPEWMAKMQGYMAARKTNPKAIVEANEPKSFGWSRQAGPKGGWGLGGLQFSQGQTPQSQENMRIINEILRQNTGGAVGGM